jgi:hypothetical protein
MYSRTVGSIIRSWHNPLMFRQCQVCDGHVPFERLRRRLLDSMYWTPIILMDRTLLTGSQTTTV